MYANLPNLLLHPAKHSFLRYEFNLFQITCSYSPLNYSKSLSLFFQKTKIIINWVSSMVSPHFQPGFLVLRKFVKKSDPGSSFNQVGCPKNEIIFKFIIVFICGYSNKPILEQNLYLNCFDLKWFFSQGLNIKFSKFFS